MHFQGVRGAVSDFEVWANVPMTVCPAEEFQNKVLIAITLEGNEHIHLEIPEGDAKDLVKEITQAIKGRGRRA